MNKFYKFLKVIVTLIIILILVYQAIMFERQFGYGEYIYPILCLLIILFLNGVVLHDILVITGNRCFFQLKYNYSFLILGVVFGLMFILLGHLNRDIDKFSHDSYIMLGVMLFLSWSLRGDRYIIFEKKKVYFSLNTPTSYRYHKIEKVSLENNNLLIKKTNSSRMRNIELPENFIKKELLLKEFEKMHKL